MTIIEIRPSREFHGAWQAWEAPGVEPAFAGPKAKHDALEYARNRFGGRAGEIHVYDDAETAIEQTIPHRRTRATVILFQKSRNAGRRGGELFSLRLGGTGAQNVLIDPALKSLRFKQAPMKAKELVGHKNVATSMILNPRLPSTGSEHRSPLDQFDPILPC